MNACQDLATLVKGKGKCQNVRRGARGLKVGWGVGAVIGYIIEEMGERRLLTILSFQTNLNMFKENFSFSIPVLTSFGFHV